MHGFDPLPIGSVRKSLDLGSSGDLQILSDLGGATSDFC